MYPCRISAYRILHAAYCLLFSVLRIPLTPYPLILTIFCILLTLLPICTTSAFAGDDPFTYPSNWGGTGLMEIPTARIMRENSYRLGVSQVRPYRYYYGAISPLKGL